MAKVNESDFIHAEIPPKWISNAKDNLEEKLKDDDFRRILDFFVIFTPCKELSARAKPLKEKYGWKSKRELKRLTTALRNSLPKGNIFKFSNKWIKMKAVLAEADLIDNFPSNIKDERCGFYQKSKQNQANCIFYHLRNCLAHGRFCIREKDGDWTFIFEDVEKNSKVSARMILKKSTLLRWIEIIEGGEASLAST